MTLKCVPGEKLLAIATLFSIEFSCGLDGNEVLAWSDFFGAVTAGLIAIGNRKIYICDPTSDCCAKQKESQTTTSPSDSKISPKKCSR